ncbi:unnamed protein product [Pedinophyceae sp. YPF-701]|nr:unnamed protein product [Pedinophyceae sp. YPF-701]
MSQRSQSWRLHEAPEFIQKTVADHLELGHLRDVAGSFFRSVDWGERWLLGLFAAEAALLLLVLATRRHGVVQAAIFAACAATVHNAERINAWLAARWRAFAGGPYFDERGRFLGLVLCLPLLVVMAAQLGLYLTYVGREMVRAKRLQLRHEARAQQRREGGAAETRKAR